LSTGFTVGLGPMVGEIEGLVVGVGIVVGETAATIGVGVGVGADSLEELTALKPKNNRIINTIAKIKYAGFLLACLLCGVKVGIASNCVSSICYLSSQE